MYSGLPVKKGSGVYRVGADGKAMLIGSKKEVELVRRKINPKSVRWTIAYREAHNKINKTDAKKIDHVSIVKNKRGFCNIPIQLIKSNK